MVPIERKAKSYLIRILWAAVNSAETSTAATVPKLVKFLTSNSNLSADEAKRLISDAVEDGFLVSLSPPTPGSGRTKGYRIPVEDKSAIQESPCDLYCFECHESRNLQKCSTCPRAFHVECIPQDPNIVTTTQPRQQQRYPDSNQQLNDSVSDSGMADITEASVLLAHRSSRNIEDEITENQDIDMKPTIDQSSLKTENSLSAEDEPDTKDVICVGEVRPPSRRNRRIPSSSYKDAINIIDEVVNDGQTAQLCSLCRLQKNDALSPPMQLEETNYLLKFILGRVKTWIATDTYSPLQISTTIPLKSKEELELFQRKCFKFPKTMDDISLKLGSNEYHSCTEFQCDILDIRHCLGILYGVQSEEYEACSYLLSDCLFELSEMRKCPDCYRHSNEKSIELWFCKPCVPRHELVFAKQIGYSHWPAKVIKVENNRYDVRFFGTPHSRAVIDGVHVMPIDTDMKMLKIKKTAGFNRAMEELHIHQELLQWSPGCFSYEAERTNPVDLSGIGPKRFNKKSAGKRKRLNSSSMTIDENETLNLSAVSFNRSQGQMGSLSREIPAAGGSQNSKKKKAKPTANSTPTKKIKVNPKGKNNAKVKSAVNDTQTSNSNKTPPHEILNNGQDSEVSSTQDNSDQQKATSTISARIKANLGKPRYEAVETLRVGLVALNCLPEAVKLATETFQSEIERLVENQSRTISETKKRQWCYYCEKEAIYHCCWNTAYCSTECQQKHWQMDHKKSCRRKR